eukprot:scaffold49288_cov63-Phaeocystis_antarctica.AAC.6
MVDEAACVQCACSVCAVCARGVCRAQRVQRAQRALRVRRKKRAGVGLLACARAGSFPFALGLGAARRGEVELRLNRLLFFFRLGDGTFSAAQVGAELARGDQPRVVLIKRQPD